MVELFEGDKKVNEWQSSKGNQLKWETGGKWYKADYTGYEGLSEYVISHLLARSSLKTNEFVMYELETIKYKRQTYNGVVSDDFKKDGYDLITLERLFKNTYNEGLNSIIYKTTDHEKRLETLVNMVERTTGLSGFGVYMQKILAIDALFLNEDRHTHNLAVLSDGGRKYELCPIFDNGAGLMSDTAVDYPLSADVYELLPEVEAKTFSQSFEEQLEIAEKLYGNNIYFLFTKRDVDEVLKSAENYDEQIRDRVREILYSQMNKYKYLFKKA
ncbi:hypothetical protein SAMN02745247_01788 [Butyrivibrio hungatei DSM 14810]|uniref:HipA-like C-terminal domain-containing protein n=1 Tax=Butyrivibrio hungatei DSM 14810 TaxID=1121132 RepID=A0A1M7SH26_9FIRM|nr:hypothetical protein [Butyrivibrio hungatei]SHN57775.1 hypothetical protein SAMN02745247_01788 [Butyrivibrio hungatei DSM 14810]